MDIDKNKLSGEEEYHPSDYDSSAIFDATPTASATNTNTFDSGSASSNKAANILEHLKRKNIVIAIGVIIGIFCIYKIMDVLFTPGAPRHKIVAPVQTQMPKPIQSENTSISSAPMPAATNVVAAMPSNQEQIATASVANRLNTLEQQANTEQSNLERLSTQVNDLQTSLNNMDSKLSSLTTSLQAVAAEVVKQEAVQAAKQAAKKKANSVAQAAPKAVYYIKAMVPGRAWLSTQNGGTITVSLGNNLPGYGTVEVIDPSQGTLITSSGAIIGYSSGDS